jgi:muconolactone delta-isomerase
VEFLVSMTTHVPEGTTEADVQDMRTREAARARELAAQGHLLRLWRPPLQPGEWRTLGLFSATGDSQLEQVLTSMPLRVWRSDEVTPLMPHPNDPATSEQLDPEQSGGEFLTAFTITIPEGTPELTVRDTKASEAQRARELVQQGHLRRLWTPPAEPGEWRTLGLWRARDVAEMEAILESLPLYGWMTVETTALAEHPNDPAITRRAGGMAG